MLPSEVQGMRAMNSRQLKEISPGSVRRRLGVVKRRLQASPSRTRWQKAKLLSSNTIDPPRLASLTKTESRISPEDNMLVEGNVGHYFKAGLCAISCIDEALQQAGAARSMRFWICQVGTVACCAFWCIGFLTRGSPFVI